MAVFVGRAAERARLSAEFAAVVAGRCRCVLIEGAAGVGKTTLVQEFLADIEGLQASGSLAGPGELDRVVRVDAAENEQKRDLELARRLLAALRNAASGAFARPGLQQDGQDDGGTTRDPAAGQLDDSTVGHVDPTTMAGTDRLREIGDLLVAAVADLCRLGPAVVHIDDVHWCDVPSLRLLDYVLLRTTHQRLLVVLSGRPHGSPWLDGPRRRAEAAGAVLELAGFSTADFHELCAALGVAPPSMRRTRSLVRDTDGNPLWLTRLVIARHRDGQASSGSSSGLPPAPEPLAALVRRQFDACPPDGRRLAAGVAVLGRACSLAEVCALAGIDNSASALSDALRWQLVEVTGQAPSLTLTPPHALVRAAIYYAVNPVERGSLHLAVAEATNDPVTALEHRAAAALLPDSDLAEELVQQAATESELGLNIRAADHLMLAVALSPNPDRGRSLRLEAAMFFLQGGEGAEAAAALGNDDGSPRHLYVRAHLDLLANRRDDGVRGLATSWAEASRNGDASTAAQAAGWLAQVAITAGHYGEAVLWGRRAFEAPAASTAHRAFGLTLLAAALVARDGGHDIALAELAERGRALEPTPHTAAALRISRGVVQLWSGDLIGAVTDLDPACYGDLESLHLRFIALGHYAEVSFRCGNWDAADAAGEEAVALAEAAGHTWIISFVYCTAALSPAARGDVAKSRRLLKLAAEAGAQRVPALCAFYTTAAAHLAAALDDPAGVVAACSSIEALGDGRGATAPGIFEWRDLYAEALTALGRHSDAKRELDRYEAESSERDAPCARAAIARARGVLCAATGDYDGAIEFLDHAATESDRLHMPFPAALARLHSAEIRWRRRPSKRAFDLFESAYETFDRLGARTYAARCRRYVPVAPGPRPRAHDVSNETAAPASGRATAPVSATRSTIPARAGVGTTAPNWPALTPRDDYLLDLVLSGLSFAEIATRLGVVRRRAETLAQALYAKHGVSTRAELAALYLGRLPGRPRPATPGGDSTTR